MSKKKDRLNTTYRYCPICGGKQIFIITKNISKKKYIYCCKCNKNILVKVKEDKQ